MLKDIEIALALAAVILAAALTSGCAGMFAAKTEMSYSIAPDGSHNITYSSGKDISGVDAAWEETKNGKVIHLAVDKAMTPEAATAAALQANLKLIGILESLAPLLAAAAAGPK